MFSHFFIERPIFASVLSHRHHAGGRAWPCSTLPVAQYPQITPPSIIVSCTYPGASAQVVAESVAAPIEQQVNGVEDMIYMSSQSANDGSYSLCGHLPARASISTSPRCWCRTASTSPCRYCPTWSSRPASPPASAIPTSCSSSASIRPTAATTSSISATSPPSGSPTS